MLSLIQYVQPWIRKLVDPEGDTRACTYRRQNNAVCTPVKEIILLCEWSIYSHRFNTIYQKNTCGKYIGALALVCFFAKCLKIGLSLNLLNIIEQKPLLLNWDYFWKSFVQKWIVGVKLRARELKYVVLKRLWVTVKVKIHFLVFDSTLLLSRSKQSTNELVNFLSYVRIRYE